MNLDDGMKSLQIVVFQSDGILDHEDDRTLGDDGTLIDKNGGPCTLYDPFSDKMDMEMEGLDDENDGCQIDGGSL
jgi:hypothetical protein